MDKDNEFFGEIKNETFDDEMVSSNGISYGEQSPKSNLKNILIAISAGAVFAGVLTLLFYPSKKGTQPQNLADIPTLSAPNAPIKIIPNTVSTNEVFETASIYKDGPTFDEKAKILITAPTLTNAAPTTLPPLPIQEVKKVSTQKAFEPSAKSTSAKTAPAKSVIKKITTKTIENPTNISGEVEIVTAPTNKNAIAAKTLTGWNIQLTSASSEANAKTEWDSLVKKYPNLLNNQTHTIQKTDVAGKTFYRLRISNITNSTDATNLCNQLKTYKVACFVTK